MERSELADSYWAIGLVRFTTAQP